MKTAKKFLFIITILVLLISPISIVVTEASSSWVYFIEVTIDSTEVDATLTNFPILIADTVSELATIANGGHIENTDNSGGISGSLTVPADFDIGTDDECSSDLSFEFEDYDASTGEFILWVKIPNLSSTTDTDIYFCYGDNTITSSQENINDVWSNDYVTVLHLAETSGSFLDSVGNVNGTDNVSDSGKTGFIGSGQKFDGNDYINLGQNAAWRDKTMHLSMWVKSSDGGEVMLELSEDGMGQEGGYNIKDNLKGGTRKPGSSSVHSSGTGTLNVWQKADFKFSLGSYQELYIDGTSVDTDTPEDFTPSNYELWIGSTHDDYWFDSYTGYLDEIRIASTPRSDEWVSTSHSNESDPDNFYTIGSESIHGPTLSSTTPADDATDISTTANLVMTFDEAVDAESGNIVIKKTSDDSTFETIGVTSGNVTGSGTTTITANPDGEFENNTEYYIQIDSSAFDNVSGESYAGITDTTSWSFTTEADTTNPTISSTTPADDATDISTTANLVMTFDEAVDAESGNIVIKETSDDSTFETIGVTSGNVTGSGTTTITVNPDGEFEKSTEYYVQIDSLAFDDTAGNSYAGISDTTSWSFTTGYEYYWGTPSVTTSDAIILALDDALEVYRPDSELEYQANMWVVSNISDTTNEDYQYVSVVGLIVDDPEDPDEWSMEYAAWTGIAIVEDNGDTTYDAGFEGSTAYDNMIDAADVDDPAYQSLGGSGSTRYIFPWVAGTVAKFGVKGVHYDVGPPGTGYGGAGWAAVDFVGGTTGYVDNVFPNGAYVVESGTSTIVCRDDVQTWIQIGNFLYGHLVYNSNLETGTYHSQGDYLGALVTGTHLLSEAGVRCGYMDQRSTSYHLHLGFKPSGNYFQMEDWVLNLADETWVKGGDTVVPGQYLLAEWSSSPDPPPTPGPTPTPGGPTPTPIPYVVEGGSTGGGASIWNGLVSMAESIVWNRVDDMADHSHRDVSNLTVSGVRIAVSTVYVMLRSNLNLTITMIVFGAMFILEPVRILRSIWMGIKEMIPFIG